MFHDGGAPVAGRVVGRSAFVSRHCSGASGGDLSCDPQAGSSLDVSLDEAGRNGGIVPRDDALARVIVADVKRALDEGAELVVAWGGERCS